MQRFLLRQTLFYSTRSSSFTSSIHRLFSTSLPPIKSPFAVDYLVKSCGLSRERAIRASRYIPNLDSPTNPDSVLKLLRQTGLTDADIRKTVTSQPRILITSLEKSINPVLMEFREIGFSPSQVTRLITLTPVIFACNRRSLQRIVDFWLPFLGSLEGILGALKKAPYLFTVSVDSVVQPNISFLREHCGVSHAQTRKMLLTFPSIFTNNPSKFKNAVQDAEKFGIRHDSSIFIYALYIALCHTPSKLDAKIENLRNIGFSKEEIEAMIKKHPMLLGCSCERVCNSIEFLTTEAGFSLQYIAHNVTMTTYSLEKRIIPRHYVLKSLRLKGICEDFSFSSVMTLTEERFAKRFVTPYENIVPEVFEAYEAARTGKISLRGKL